MLVHLAPSRIVMLGSPFEPLPVTAHVAAVVRSFPLTAGSHAASRKKASHKSDGRALELCHTTMRSRWSSHVMSVTMTSPVLVSRDASRGHRVPSPHATCSHVSTVSSVHATCSRDLLTRPAHATYSRDVHIHNGNDGALSAFRTKAELNLAAMAVECASAFLRSTSVISPDTRCSASIICWNCSRLHRPLTLLSIRCMASSSS